MLSRGGEGVVRPGMLLAECGDFRRFLWRLTIHGTTFKTTGIGNTFASLLLYTGAFLYVHYSFLLISNKFCYLVYCIGHCSGPTPHVCGGGGAARYEKFTALSPPPPSIQLGEGGPLEGAGPETHVHNSYLWTYDFVGPCEMAWSL